MHYARSYQGLAISIDSVIPIKPPYGKYTCLECGKAAKAYIQVDTPHFKHLQYNRTCSLCVQGEGAWFHSLFHETNRILQYAPFTRVVNEYFARMYSFAPYRKTDILHVFREVAKLNRAKTYTLLYAYAYDFKSHPAWQLERVVIPGVRLGNNSYLSATSAEREKYFYSQSLYLVHLLRRIFPEKLHPEVEVPANLSVLKVDENFWPKLG
jgi:hypothetical protein